LSPPKRGARRRKADEAIQELRLLRFFIWIASLRSR
jgi:hypothetical protein